jgi:hypothetical protein
VFWEENHREFPIPDARRPPTYAICPSLDAKLEKKVKRVSTSLRVEMKAESALQ